MNNAGNRPYGYLCVGVEASVTGKEDDDELEAENTAEEELPEEEETGRFRRFARKLMDRKELTEDTKDLLASLLATSDKAKSEAVRMMGREVRNYLDGLQLKDDLLDIATNYRLEVRASFHLEPVAKMLEDDEESETAAEED